MTWDHLLNTSCTRSMALCSEYIRNPIKFITAISFLLFIMVLLQTYVNSKGANDANINANATANQQKKVPFFYIPPSTVKDAEPPFRNLFRELEKYKENVDTGIQSLILSMEIARKTEWIIFPNEYDNNVNKDGNRVVNNLVSSRLEERIKLTAEALEEDYFVLERILKPFEITIGLPCPDNKDLSKRYNTIVNDDPMGAQKASSYDSAVQVIAHIVRDWSLEGKRSRESLYQWSIEQLKQYAHDDWIIGRRRSKVLVPGSGLGRLAYDISLAGFDVEANELSLLMAAAASAFLNGQGAYGQEQREIISGKVHPWAFDFLINEVNSLDRFQTVDFPDVPIEPDVNGKHATGMDTGTLSYTIGDFVEIYSQIMYKANFQSVVTCFFIDTASSIYEYILVIRNVLKDGGVWVNVGPLQWHQNAKLHPSGDELQVIIQSMGFEIKHWSVDDEAINYRHDDRYERTRHTKYEGYRPLRFVAVLPSAIRNSLQEEDTVRSIMDIRRVLSGGRKKKGDDDFDTNNSTSHVTVTELY